MTRWLKGLNELKKQLLANNEPENSSSSPNVEIVATELGGARPSIGAGRVSLSIGARRPTETDESQPSQDAKPAPPRGFTIGRRPTEGPTLHTPGEGQDGTTHVLEKRASDEFSIGGGRRRHSSFRNLPPP